MLLLLMEGWESSRYRTWCLRVLRRERTSHGAVDVRVARVHAANLLPDGMQLTAQQIILFLGLAVVVQKRFEPIDFNLRRLS